MTRAAVLALALAACAGARPAPLLPPTSGDEVRAAGEASLVVLTRPLAERLLVQLWIDAGSVDAAEASGHPEVASLAAWVAEARARGVHARVVPDGTVLEIEGTELGAAADALLDALAARDPSAAELDRARVVLRERRRGRAPDPLADLMLTAATALLGPLDPLGVVGPGELESTDDPPDGAVAGFLRAHYGLRRARWVVVGPIALEDAEAILSGRAGPVAEDDAHGRRLAAPSAPEPLEGEAGFALAALSPPGATRGGGWGLASSSVGSRRARFSTPCGELGLVAGGGGLDDAAVASLAFALHLGRSGAPATTARADAERAGLAFVARTERCAEVPEPRHALVVSAPSSEAARTLASRVETALGGSAAVRLAHADVDGRTAVVSIVLDGGAPEDPPQAHGRTAILARALAARCGVRARVDPEHVALETELDAGALDASLGAALRCVLAEPLPAPTLALAQAEALAALDGEARFLARAALVIAPGAPGVIAPMGSAEGLAGASGLDDALARLRGTARLSIGFVAPEAPGEGVARALGALPTGTPASHAPPAAGPEEVRLAAIEAEAVELVLAWRAEGVADAPGVAAVLSRELAASPLVLVHAAAGTFGTTSWMALAVRGEPDALDAALELAHAAVERAEPRLEEALAARAAARAALDPGGSPLALAHRLAEGEVRAPTLEAARALLSAPMRRVIIRPSSGPLRTR